MTTPLPPKEGDVYISGNKEWKLVHIHREPVHQDVHLLENFDGTKYSWQCLTDMSGFLKKEPVFEVGKNYSRTDDPSIVYTVAIVDGVDVLVYYTLNGQRLCSWIPYEERKNFVEVA